MKIITPLLLLLLLTKSLMAQEKNIKIHGTVRDTSIKIVEIGYITDTNFLTWESKKVNVIDTKFSTSLQIPFPTKIILKYGNRASDENYIYNDAEILIDTVGKIHISGSPIQDEYKSRFLPFFESNNRVYDSLMSYFRKYGSNFPKAVKDSVNLLREKYGYQRADLLGKYIKLHPDSYIALWDIYYFVCIPAAYKYFDFERLLSSFSNQLQQEPLISILREKIKESNKMQTGQILPDVFFKGHEQIQAKIKNDSQYYLIDFWFSHCGPCIAEFPRLKNIYNKFHGKGFDIVSISIDGEEYLNDYKAAIKKNNLLWNHVWDKDGRLAKKYNINSFPTYILLDKNNKIIQHGIKVNELEVFLKENL